MHTHRVGETGRHQRDVREKSLSQYEEDFICLFSMSDILWCDGIARKHSTVTKLCLFSQWNKQLDCELASKEKLFEAHTKFKNT